MKKLKRYRIPLSPIFPTTHPKKGEETRFKCKLSVFCMDNNTDCRCSECKYHTSCGRMILDFPKKHTIRENVDYWKKRIDEINKGNAVLEVYEWIGKPYGKGSTTKILFTFDKHSGIGYQDLLFSKSNLDFPIVFNRNNGVLALMPNNLAKNDGLSLQDFKDWFKKSNLSKPKIIIHFTKFRY